MPLAYRTMSSKTAYLQTLFENREYYQARNVVFFKRFLVLAKSNIFENSMVAYRALFRTRLNFCDGEFLQKKLTAFSRKLFSNNAPSKIFERVLITPLGIRSSCIYLFPKVISENCNFELMNLV